MQVIDAELGFAQCRDRNGEERRIDLSLVGPCAVGDWLLIFLDAARERLDAQRASEIDSTLRLLEEALFGTAPQPDSAPGFSLPSAMSAGQLAALLGHAPPGQPNIALEPAALTPPQQSVKDPT
jgi:hydrogenase expression/formation protein HypC